MSKMKLREGEIITLKQNIDEKESQIVSLNEVVENKDIFILKPEADRKEVKAKWFEANTNHIGKNPACGAKHILWDHLSTKITKFGEYLNLIKEENALALSSNQICRNLKEELAHRSIEEEKSIISFMNTRSKANL